MTKPAVSCRRINQLKTVAFDLGFTNEDARLFGKLSKTDTWQKLLRAHGINSDSYLATINECLNSEPVDIYVNSTANSPKPINFLEWVDLSQLIALTFASVGLFVLLTYVWQYNPLKFLPSPIRITIQIGTKL
ncbi:MAG: hypothetical protein JGK17_28260 [Microcoleus sp. PH2017_10_PVI_O_A]|uniref:hypothetical protein n=1 Tax=unclassified Microcoleus TaxID=2642155 RepID=UPI001D72DF73|nr:MULTISPECIES: hypothetical protein [unclassified Microcoleus]MCC3530737.1 hypothetical protein [Microcoleus sp. PH2017_21_RUC_O_A]MCC3543117.1 hypothetical protein [Microcoleus sp. PH2017_22_RUC_O_B]MCC3409381.1 hypothetical protein [Microcoleus sp. PH2017_10_PVI_O_A]MCC3463624.1 hypothetical protein [Microcoleus sp. PH2017_11_PCY_U_A]MCC3481968.1 hypothetical protein [Microcoleus sp. PH2017_12_PCY_D_A]